MTIGKNGVKNLAFVPDESKYGSFKSTSSLKEIENGIQPVIKCDLNEPKSDLYVDKKLTKKGFTLIFALASTIFASCTSWSLIAPFFPRVAESKGLSIAQYSLIFTIYEINKFILPPFLSKLSIKMTPKYGLCVSMLIIGWCSTIFGFLIYSKDSQFFALCLLVRCCWSVGGAGGITCANLVGVLLFPNHVATVYAVIEIGAGLGFIVGPFFGGYLYEFYGFPAPFLATALLAFLSIIPISFLVKNELKPKKNKEETPTTFWSAIRLPAITVNLIMSAVACFSIGFNDSTLDYHLREIGEFSPSQVGQIFLIVGVIYSFCTWGYSQLAAKCDYSFNFIFVGCFCLTMSFIFVGPIDISLLPFLKPSVYYVMISQAFFGVGLGAIFVLSFDECVKQAKAYLGDTDSTMAIVSGLYTSSYALGNAVGPFVGGQLIERIGYRKTTHVFALTVLASTVLVAIYIFKIRKPIKKPEIEKEEDTTSMKDLNKTQENMVY